jgi:hypothetical protein
VREDGERAGGLARPHLAVEREAVEVLAPLGRQVCELAADRGDAVRVLHCADERAGLVAPDPHRLPGDARGLGGEAVLRLGARLH